MSRTSHLMRDRVEPSASCWSSIKASTAEASRFTIIPQNDRGRTNGLAITKKQNRQTTTYFCTACYSAGRCRITVFPCTCLNTVSVSVRGKAASFGREPFPPCTSNLCTTSSVHVHYHASIMTVQFTLISLSLGASVLHFNVYSQHVHHNIVSSNNNNNESLLYSAILQ